jgi:hypothetical protein
VTLAIDAAGALTLTTHDMGTADDAAWGIDDEERTLVVGSEDVALLACSLVAENLKDEPDPVGAFAKLCERFGISARLAWWT